MRWNGKNIGRCCSARGNWRPTSLPSCSVNASQTRFTKTRPCTHRIAYTSVGSPFIISEFCIDSGIPQPDAVQPTLSWRIARIDSLHGAWSASRCKGQVRTGVLSNRQEIIVNLWQTEPDAIQGAGCDAVERRLWKSEIARIHRGLPSRLKGS